MRLTIVGCAGSYPGPDSAASSYLLESEHEGRTWRVVIDLGNGSLGQLQRHCDPRDVDAIIISHLHPDHCIDIVSWSVLAKYHPDGPYRCIPVHAPEAFASYIATAGGPGAEAADELLDPRPLVDGGTFTVGPFAFRSAEVDHPVPAYAFRVETPGGVLAYSGDTGPTPVLDDIARDADLFLCEASFVESGDNPPNLHLTGADAGRAAISAGARHLLVTHVPAWTDAAEVEADLKSVWDGAYTFVTAGAVFEV